MMDEFGWLEDGKDKQDTMSVHGLPMSKLIAITRNLRWRDHLK